jgi:membrane protein
MRSREKAVKALTLLWHAGSALWSELREAARIFRARGGRLMSGAVVILQVAASFIDESSAQSTLRLELEHWVGPSGAATVLSLVDGMRSQVARDNQSAVSWTNAGPRVGAFLFLLYGSTRLWSQMQRALDILWQAETEAPEKKPGTAAAVLRQLRKRVLSFSVVVLTGICLVALALGHASLARLHTLAETAFGTDSMVPSRALAAGGSFLATVFLFFIVMITLPHRKMPVFATLQGAAVTSLLFTLGTLLVGAYVAHKAASSTYGSATAIVMLLLWVHYSAHVFFLGAAFTFVHAQSVVALPAVTNTYAEDS